MGITKVAQPPEKNEKIHIRECKKYKEIRKDRPDGWTKRKSGGMKMQCKFGKWHCDHLLTLFS